MINFKATSTLGVFFSFVLVLSCSSLDKIIKDPKASLAKSLNQSALKKTDKEMILSKIEKIPAPEKEKLIAFSKTNHGKTISELYSTDYINSLKNILKTTGTLKVNSFESFLIDFLKFDNTKDTVYITNLNLSTPKNGEIKSFVYDVKIDEEIFYEIKNLKSNTVKEIEILEGAATRFKQNKLKKKESVKGSIKIVNDNALTINISNDNFFKNKGLFKSKLNIVLKKIAPPENLIIERKSDTVVQSFKVIEEVNDTVYKVVRSKKHNIGPILDITQSNVFSFPIVINEFDELIGWSYWIGLNKEDVDLFELAAAEENPLIGFSKNEINGLLNQNLLPKSENTDLELLILNQSLGKRSLNYSNNFAFYFSDDYTRQNYKKAEVYITNNSKLYDHEVSYWILAVGIRKLKKEGLKDVLAIKDYIQINLVKDEE